MKLALSTYSLHRLVGSGEYTHRDLIKIAKEAKKCGAYRFRYCDTLGFDDPKTAYDRIYTIAKETGMEMEMHFHNDLGMATACSVMGAKAAIDAGVDAWINTAINGMGERAGNADLVSCILAITKSSGFKDKYQIDPQIDISKAWKLAKYTSYAFGVDIPMNQVAVGANAFALFTKNQRQWVAAPLTAKSIKLFKENCAKGGFDPQYILPHDSYLINLGQPDPEKRRKAIDSFINELELCRQVGI